jgi:hypothetical protein
MSSTFIRHSRAPILQALADTRVVYVMGARQASAMLAARTSAPGS